MDARAEQMAADYGHFRALLEKAIRQISPQYFASPVAGQDKPIVRERNFCYELHHQLRNAFDSERFGLTLGAEIDKSGHPIIQSDVIPDLIVHEAGNMEHNVCVLEVKPITGATAGFQKDIKTLQRFVTDYRYHSGLLLVFGSLPLGEARIRAKAAADFAVLREVNIRVLWISKPHGALIELA